MRERRRKRSLRWAWLERCRCCLTLLRAHVVLACIPAHLTGNEVLFEGYYYRTLDNVPPSPAGAMASRCQEEGLPLPTGWALSPKENAIIESVVSACVA